MNLETIIATRPSERGPGVLSRLGPIVPKLLVALLILSSIVVPQIRVSLLLLIVGGVLFVACYHSLPAGLALVLIYEAIVHNFLEAEPALGFIGPFAIAATDGLWMFYLSIFFFRILTKKSLSHKHLAEWRWLLIFIGILIASIASGFPVYVQSAFGDARPFLDLVCLACYCASFRLDERTLNAIFKIFLVFVGFHVLLALLRWAGIIGMPWYVVELADPGYWAYRAVDETKTFFMFLLATAMFVFLRTGLLKRGPSTYVGIAFLFAMVIIMQHRSVWVVAIIVVLFSFFMLLPLRTKLVSIILFMALAAVLFLTDVRISNSGGLVGTLYSSTVSTWEDPHSTANWRVLNWMGLLTNMSLKDYLVGTPFGTYYPGRVDWAGEIPANISPHNFFVRLIYKLGSVGLLVYLILQLLLMKRLWQTGRRMADPFKKSVALILFLALLGFNAMFFSFEPTLDYGIFLGLSLAFVQRDEVRLLSRTLQ